MAPRLREIVATSNVRRQRNHAATALISLNEPVWPRDTQPNVEGCLYESAADLVDGDENAWKHFSKTIAKLKGSFEALEAFPCNAKLLPKLSELEQMPIIKNAIGQLRGRRCFAADDPIDLDNSLAVIHGNLTINGNIRKSIVVVTGDVYLHDGAVTNSLVFAQGRFICDGGIRNSIVVVGDDKPLHVDDYGISKSIVVAGTLIFEDSMSESVFDAELPGGGESRSSFSRRIRNSSTFDAELMRRLLRKNEKESER